MEHIPGFVSQILAPSPKYHNSNYRAPELLEQLGSDGLPILVARPRLRHLQAHHLVRPCTQLTVLQRAVEKASDAGALIFAAASNWGNRGSVPFPARHSFRTMCMFSTNADDQASSFNPEPRERENNFAILGEDLEHPADPQRRESGTSMATAIAAGLAARIVDFSRQGDNATIERVADVGSLAGMTAIFRFMSKRAGPFQCVSPLRLMSERYRSNAREKNRAYVRESLHRAMESAD
ncbi:uncharacterized protein BO97DRAFT_45016 [Aspergillus homomorphus CBS 101889]|uniref:Peptidase S8/S53 domain-containing protein n=1 Tax=Aspergillus homomorphus (strain CBS 101889) TaxID=1450537 RepID=A0A395I1Z1_ASPHC|nr:hypothetical protein BO97DRAFT_45016 [Aspergillus homomorphus CBS 101889]RAL13188.1 hypothetical protein BO97DRAFT_45016 [Aspergillus homomorphus CBS 101889]